MSNFSFDLKALRDNLNISQTELAILLGWNPGEKSRKKKPYSEQKRDFAWSPDKISKLEKNPGNISLNELWEISEKTGVAVDEILKMEKRASNGLHPVDNWTDVINLKQDLLERIADVEADLSLKGRLNDLSLSVDAMFRKPKVAFFGKSDAGKSTMINALLGSEKMETAWTTTTSITVYLKHIDDKPAYALKENENYMMEECWIFQNEQDGTPWNDLRLQDEKYCKKLMIARGGTDVLREHGTFLEKKENESINSLATTAVFFLDADILKVCDLIDLPGFGEADSNIKAKFNEMGEKAKNLADIYIYLSVANAFMQEDDVVFLCKVMHSLENEMRERETLESADKISEKNLLKKLFVVSSQAQIIGNKYRKNSETGETETIYAEELRREIIDEGCNDLWKALAKQDFEKFCKKEEVRSRFFTYSIDREDIRKEFELELSSVLEKLPSIIKEESLKSVKANIKAKREEASKKIRNFEEIIEKKEMVKAKLEGSGEKIDRITANIKRRNVVVEKIRNYKKYDLEKFGEIYSDIVNKESIKDEIEKLEIRKKTKDVQMLTTRITWKLDNKQQKLLEKHSNALMKEIDEYLDNYILFEDREGVDVKVGFAFFDAANIFAGSLAGMTTIGGLSSWAAGMGNLGGYIALAKGVSLLSRLGIHLGGTAAVASAVSAIGGPATIGIALAATAGIAGYTLLSANWKEPLANRIVKAYEKEATLEKYQDCIRKFWENTERAFLKANEDVEREREKYINQLREFVAANDDTVIEREIEDARAIQDGLGHHLRKIQRMEQETLKNIFSDDFTTQKF